jgi:hypothetical protein
VTRIAGNFELGDVTLGSQRPGIGPATVPARLSNGRGAGEIMDANVGRPDAVCDHVIAHFTNLPMILPSELLAIGRDVWTGRWRGSVAGWQLTLDMRSDHTEVMNELRRSVYFGVTHVGELRKTDGTGFSPEEAAEALRAWQVVLSFAVGRWVAPVAPVGLDASGQRVWEQWGSWRCDRVFGNFPWWDHRDGDDLKMFVELFLRAWFDRGKHDVTWYIASLLIAADHHGTTVEARLMLAQAALEYLSWVTYVLGGLRSRKDHKERTAEDNLRELLHAASIPTPIPGSLVGLRQYAAAEVLPDGPAALPRLRNRLVHPRDAGEPYRIENSVSDAWRLVTE